MNIGFVYPYCSPSVGGVETYLLNLTETYIKKGVFVTMFVSDPHYAAQKKSGDDASPAVDANPKIIYLKPKKLFGYDAPAATDVHKALTKNPVDILHYQIPHPYCAVFALAARRHQIPSIATYHADVNPSSIIKKIGAALDRSLCRFLYRAVITTTGWYARRVARFFPANRITAIAPGVDPFFCEAHHEEENRMGAMFVGGMDDNHRYKGLPILLNAAVKTPDISYTIIGDGSRKKEFESLARELGLKNVTFAGAVSKKDLRSAYQKTAVLALPSTSSSEGYGMVLLEAMACNAPVITTDSVGSREEMERSGAAVIVPSGNAEALTKAIKHIISDRPAAKKMQKQGSIFVRSHSWDNVAAETLHLYEHILPKTGR